MIAIVTSSAAVLIFLAAVLAPDTTWADESFAGVALTLLDGQATTYATFQSHNQKVVSNAHGIFTTHIRSRDEPFLAQQWRLSRSVDNGATFQTLYEATHATNPPAMETDAAGRLYLGRPDFADGSAYLYRFTPDDGYAEPKISLIAEGSAGKFSLTLDPERERLYWFTWGRSLFTLGLNGIVRGIRNLTADGTNAGPQYPHSFLDTEGTLHTAWTTQKHNVYLYWDIHYMASDDGGGSWRRMDGTSLDLPVPVDDSGLSDRVTLDDEFEVHSWLSNFYVRDGKAHFAYSAQAQPWRQHYVRYDLATAVRDVDLFPEFRGEQIQLASLDGFFASRRDVSNATIYYVSSAFGQLGCLASDDDGQSWYDYAITEERFNLYSIGGARELSADGGLIGTFTDQRATAEQDSSQVWFFRIQAGLSWARLQDMRLEAGRLRARFDELRGQPAQVRFRAAGNDAWGPWLPLTDGQVDAEAAQAVPGGGAPASFQLHSRLGVDSDVFDIDAATAVTEQAGVEPQDVSLAPPYPNPFNASVAITFQVRRPGTCRLAVFDSNGQRVRSLLDGSLAAGEHRASWDGRDDDGNAVASGVYFARLHAGDVVRTVQLALVR